MYRSTVSTIFAGYLIFYIVDIKWSGMGKTNACQLGTANIGDLTHDYNFYPLEILFWK